MLTRVLRTLALALWVGGIFFFAFGVAPVAFHVLLNSHEAGLLVGASLRVLHLLGLCCGAVYLLASIGRRIATPTPRPAITSPAISPRITSPSISAPSTSTALQFGIIPPPPSAPKAQPQATSAPILGTFTSQPSDDPQGAQPTFTPDATLHAHPASSTINAPEAQQHFARSDIHSTRSGAPLRPSALTRLTLHGRLPELLVVSMLSLTAFSQFAIIPRMERDRVRAGGIISNVPLSTPARRDFDRLHHLSEQLEGAVLLAGLLALALTAAAAAPLKPSAAP